MFSTVQTLTRILLRNVGQLPSLQKLARQKSFKAKYVLTNNEFNIYKRLFEDMDSDRDGFLTRVELKKGLKSFADHSASDEELDEAMKTLDADKKGTIGLKEFISYIAWTKQTQLEDTLKRAFASVDRNKDGLVSKEELRKALEKLGIKTFSERDLKKLMALSDKDKDGSISLEEFKTLFYEDSVRNKE